jgi:hypothetical protein
MNLGKLRDYWVSAETLPFKKWHNTSWSRLMDILVMLTPHSGHVDPSVDFGQKDNFMTILQFFS